MSPPSHVITVAFPLESYTVVVMGVEGLIWSAVGKKSMTGLQGDSSKKGWALAKYPAGAKQCMVHRMHIPSVFRNFARQCLLQEVHMKVAFQADSLRRCCSGQRTDSVVSETSGCCCCSVSSRWRRLVLRRHCRTCSKMLHCCACINGATQT